MIELYRSNDETEALGIEAELRAHGIETASILLGSTPYPGLVDRGPTRILRVDARDAPRARALLEAWLAERSEDAKLDEDELARAALEADDTDPEELAKRRDALARVERGGAYREAERAGERRAHDRSPSSDVGWRVVALIAAAAAALAAMWELGP